MQRDAETATNRGQEKSAKSIFIMCKKSYFIVDSMIYVKIN